MGGGAADEEKVMLISSAFMTKPISKRSLISHFGLQKGFLSGH